MIPSRSEPPPPSWADRVRGAVRRVMDTLDKLIDRLRAWKARERPPTSVSSFAQRPPDWTGYWSPRYGTVLARTLNLAPPIDASQREMLAVIPRPLQETFDPVASLAEPMDRAGRPARWRLARSSLFALLGPVGLAVGGLALAVVAFRVVIAVSGLPPLVTPRRSPPQVQQPQPLQPLRQQPQSPAQAK